MEGKVIVKRWKVVGTNCKVIGGEWKGMGAVEDLQLQGQQ
jgi:hypothetical protein